MLVKHMRLFVAEVRNIDPFLIIRASLANYILKNAKVFRLLIGIVFLRARILGCRNNRRDVSYETFLFLVQFRDICEFYFNFKW
jgi:hypothetical protein